MKLYLVAGGNCEALKQNLEKDGEIYVVKLDKMIDDLFVNLKSGSLKFDRILLTDQGINCSTEEFGKTIGGLKALMESLYPDADFKFVTKEPIYEQVFKKVTGEDRRFKAYYTDKIKIPITLLHEVCMEKSESHRVSEIAIEQTNKTLEKKRSWFPFKRFEKQKEEQNQTDLRMEKTQDSDCYNNQVLPNRLTSFSSGLNRIIAITGHRGAGTSGTVANLAVTASMYGLKTIVLDMDIEYRTMNLYFSKFGDEVELNADLAASLIKCMLKPDSYEMNSCRINENLSVITLAYSIDSKDKLFDFINVKRFLSLITALKSKFNLVLLDIPMHVLKDFSDILVHLDSMGLCVNNNLYSIINTVKAIGDSFEGENLTILKMKTKVVITKYSDGNRHQGKKLTEEMTCEILSEISDVLGEHVRCAGIIPFTKDFEQQIETGKKICTISNEYKRYYTGGLNNLM